MTKRITRPKQPQAYPEGIAKILKGGKRGRHNQWNAEFSERIMAIHGRGRPVDDVAILLGMSESQLRLVYNRELRLGYAKAHARLDQTAHEVANGRETLYDKAGKLIKKELLPNQRMIEFLLLSKAGYRLKEPQRVADDPPLPTQVVRHSHIFDFSKLTDDELATYQALARKAAQIPAVNDNAGGSGGGVDGRIAPGAARTS